jgi:hypothetical protein
MARKVGDRVGAICGEANGVLSVFGFGVFEGDFEPLEAVGWLAEAAREDHIANPRIRLDSGKVVYGCECWWGSEDEIRARITVAEQAGTEVRTVDIDEIRAAVNAA